MKTSNKLLIAFASALILIPLMGMIYVSAVKYKKGSYTDQVDVVSKSEKNFNTPTENMESKAISTAFESIDVEDAKQHGLYINFVKDENYGVKVPKELKDSINFKVDEKGQLQIAFNMKRNERGNRYITIHVYGKNLKQMNISNANSLYFDVTGDSVQLNLRKIKSAGLNKDITLNALNITTDEVESLDVNEIKVKSLNVNLNGTNFKSDESSYDSLSITAAGKTEIELNGSDNKKDKKYFIKKLFIKTLNEADVKFENIKVDQCSGSFSDQTKVQMPAVNLNQMYKR
ncbi:DUF2807 domain-containing protein [Pedobacter sp. Du54]|uniref:GIN domain-containing protein n=1 Tax=Pedobacter anseongensis TaxID=3133439 RepID=UPI0030B1D1D7